MHRLLNPSGQLGGRSVHSRYLVAPSPLAGGQGGLAQTEELVLNAPYPPRGTTMRSPYGVFCTVRFVKLEQSTN